MRVAFVLVAAAFAFGCLAGCGDDDGGPAVTPAADRSKEISGLEEKVADLKAKGRRASRAAKKQAGKAGAATREHGLDALVAGLPGQAGIVVSGPGGDPGAGGGALTTGPAWSTIKVPIAQRVLEDGGGPDGVGAATRNRITAAITLSDNEAAAALFAGLESTHGGLAGASGAVGQMLRAAGDGSTDVSTRGRDGFSTYGQTEWSLTEQNRYMAKLAGGCFGDDASRRFLLDQMSAAGGSDTFGLGSTGLPGRWKGGWGPGTDHRYLVRQMGVIEAGGGPVVVAMAAIPDDGTFESGQTMLNEISARLVERYSGSAPPRRAC